MKTVLTSMPERLYIEYRDSTNTLINPTRPRVTVYNNRGETVVASTEPTNESVGVYFYTITVSSSYATPRGLYQAWWEGYINGGPVSMDEPIYFEVMDRPVVPSSTSYGRGFVRQIRNAIGDNQEDDWLILPQDLNYYIQDGVRNANASFDFGYRVSVSTAGNNKSGRIDFIKSNSSTSLSVQARTWYALNVVKDIMEAQTRLNMFGAGKISAGDIKISLGLRDQTGYLKLLREDVERMEVDLRMNGATGVNINTYAIADIWVSEFN